MKLMKIKITNCQFVAMILFFTAISLISCASNKGKVKIAHLTCDYLENPILVSSQTPCFGWQLISGKNDVQQSAYAIEVYVDSNGEKKKIWNSGKVQSSQNQRVKYKGKTKLETGKKNNRKVQIWEKEDIETERIETATFFLSPLILNQKPNGLSYKRILIFPKVEIIMHCRYIRSSKEMAANTSTFKEAST